MSQIKVYNLHVHVREITHRHAYLLLHVPLLTVHTHVLVAVIGMHSTMHLMHPNYWQITIYILHKTEGRQYSAHTVYMYLRCPNRGESSTPP